MVRSIQGEKQGHTCSPRQSRLHSRPLSKKRNKRGAEGRGEERRKGKEKRERMEEHYKKEKWVLSENTEPSQRVNCLKMRSPTSQN